MIDPQFAHRIQLSERLRRRETKLKFASFAQQAVYCGGIDGAQVHTDEIAERSAAWFGLEERHPLNDRRLVEFALALPEEQRWQDDQMKFILREAMRRYLPEQVQQRRLQADFSILFAKTFEVLDADRAFERLAIASQGWVESGRVREIYRRMTQLYAEDDLGYISHIWSLWMVLGIDLWFRAIFLSDEVFSP